MVTDQVKSLLRQVDSLSIEEKISLVQELLKCSGLQVVMNGGNNFVTTSIVFQIQNSSAEVLLPIFQILADRISKDLNGSK